MPDSTRRARFRVLDGMAGEAKPDQVDTIRQFAVSLAVAAGFQGRGLGGALLADAARRSIQSPPAVYALVVDAKNDQAVAFYQCYLFKPLVGQPRTLFLPLRRRRHSSLSLGDRGDALTFVACSIASSQGWVYIERTRTSGFEVKKQQEITMKSGKILLILAVLLAAACFAADVNVGTWKVNAAKSKNLPSDEKNTTIAIAATGDSMKVTFDGIDDKGKPTHEEWMGKFDGKDYPVPNDPDIDTLAYKTINDRTLAVNVKKGGKIVETDRIVYSADGKTRTVMETRTNANGTKTKDTVVYDRQ